MRERYQLTETAERDLAEIMDIEILGLGVAVRDIAVWVGHHPAPDEKLPATDFRETGGGPVATALTTLSGFGRRCAFAGIVGDDGSGRLWASEAVKQ